MFLAGGVCIARPVWRFSKIFPGKYLHDMLCVRKDPRRARAERLETVSDMNVPYHEPCISSFLGRPLFPRLAEDAPRNPKPLAHAAGGGFPQITMGAHTLAQST